MRADKHLSIIQSDVVNRVTHLHRQYQNTKTAPVAIDKTAKVCADRFSHVIILLLLSIYCLGCSNHSQNQSAELPELQTTGSTTEKPDAKFSFEQPPSIRALASGDEKPPSSEDLGDAAEGWFFGPGLGRTIANVGTVVVFPPYAVYLLGNAGLALAGYKPLNATDAIPEQPREYVLTAYDGVTSVPGRLTAFIAGKEYPGPSSADTDQEK